MISAEFTRIIDRQSGYHFIPHTKKEDWGISIHFMEINGNGYGRIYQYSDDLKTYYIEGISVSPKVRRLGMAATFMNLIYQLAISDGIRSLILKVKKDSWVVDWYLRLGYRHFKECEEEKEYCWMRKKL